MSRTALQTYDPDAFATPAITERGRVCNVCLNTKPESAFKSPKTNQCNKCRKQTDVNRKNIQLKAALTRLVSGQIIAAARGDRLDAPRISQITAEMMRLRGGVEGFCKAWSEQIDFALLKNPGSKTALDQFSALAKLVANATASMDGAGSLASLTDEELDRELAASMVKLVGNDDALLLESDPAAEDEEEKAIEDDDDAVDG